MKIKLLIFFLSMFFLLNAQNYKLSLKLSTALVNAQPIINEGTVLIPFLKPQFFIGANFEPINNLELGIKIGYSNIGHSFNMDYVLKEGKVIQYTRDEINSNSLAFGFNCKYSVLSKLLNSKNSFDIYPIINLNFITQSWIDIYTGDYHETKLFAEYGFGLGISYKFTKRTSLFFDFTKGRYYNYGDVKPELGIKMGIL